MNPETQFKTINELLDYCLNDAKATNQLYNKTMNKQEIALANVRNGKYIVGSIDIERGLSFNSNPATHDTPQTARTECARLAKMYPGKAFVFVKMAGAELVPVSQTVSI